uniref:Uncharacterized protein n=1 Tax=Oryza meridionalis TaxID=40149 RepID=A0A0E0EPY6_9ORYZ
MEKCLLVDGSFSLFLQRNRHAGALLSAIQVWYDDDRRRERLKELSRQMGFGALQKENEDQVK